MVITPLSISSSYYAHAEEMQTDNSTDVTVESPPIEDQLDDVTTQVGTMVPLSTIVNTTNSENVLIVNSTTPVTQTNSTTPVTQTNSTTPVTQTNSTTPVTQTN
ncbi:hypothetical protein, partial [Candidatus Nitrosotenuis cloacae]|uniref:hypothetical protein n=1 Tax=Candidatus Nitrosotenuis cloacae TaxID=1603555 RepID=UPI003B96930B